MSRNIGGSLLPSNNASILKAVETPFGTLQVRVVEQLDTHALFWRHERGECVIAMHPNGFSCHVLLKEMADGNLEKALKQYDYILACGGLAMSRASIANAMSHGA